jgi:hypothetical protein
MTPYDQLPKEIKYKIISKLAIDERRALDIYTSLKIPYELSVKLTEVLKNKPKACGCYTILELPLSKTSTYKIAKCYDETIDEFIDCRVIQQRQGVEHFSMVWCILDF